jgi:predicted helicase
MFLVKKLSKESKTCQIKYVVMDDFWPKEQKLQWFIENPISNLQFDNIKPDKNNNWISLSENNWDDLMSVYENGKESIFSFYSNGIVTARDEWVFDYNNESLATKISYIVKNYNANLKQKEYDLRIKWSEGLKKNLSSKRLMKFDNQLIKKTYFRPFTTKLYYSDRLLSDRLTSNHYKTFGADLGYKNQIIVFSIPNSNVFSVGSTVYPVEFKTAGTATGGSAYLPFNIVEGEKKLENITSWALSQFQIKYESKDISRKEIFHYVYAVLHNPAYRTKYELNLKREFPRIPFYDNFTQWSKWGKQLMDLHINYEEAKPFKLKEITDQEVKNPKAKLKALKEEGTIILDEATTLTGIPAEAWQYKLGNRSALEWVLDQYKESKPKDPTIAEKFNTYKFADYKEHVIDLLKKVCTVSVETIGITKSMENG